MIPDEVPETVEHGMIGHNSGTMLETARAAQLEALHDTPRDGGKTFAQRRDEFIRSAAAQNVRSRQTAADAGDTIKLATEFRAEVNAERKRLSDPYREVHLNLSAMETAFLDPLNTAMEALHGQIDAWTQENDAQIEQQRREQAEAMAAMRKPTAAAPAPAGRQHIDYSAPAPVIEGAARRAPRRARIIGDLGATISTREIAHYEIEDMSLIPEHIMNSPTVREAILTVVRQTAKHMGVPAGIRKITTTGNQVR